MMNFTRQVSIDDFVSSPTYVSWPFEYRLSEANLDPGEILEENPPVYFRRNLENMSAIAKAHNVKIMLSTWAHSPYLNDYASEDYYQLAFAENNDVVKEVAADQQIPLFDFAEVMPQDVTYWADGRHVNEAGAIEKARLFADYIHQQELIDP